MLGLLLLVMLTPPALDEMVRICKNGSLICFTINIGIYEEYGFDKKIKELEDKNSWKIIEFFKSNYGFGEDTHIGYLEK